MINNTVVKSKLSVLSATSISQIYGIFSVADIVFKISPLTSIYGCEEAFQVFKLKVSRDKFRWRIVLDV
jgi:hypothetical protein